MGREEEFGWSLAVQASQAGPIKSGQSQGARMASPSLAQSSWGRLVPHKSLCSLDMAGLGTRWEIREEWSEAAFTPVTHYPPSVQARAGSGPEELCPPPPSLPHFGAETKLAERQVEKAEVLSCILKNDREWLLLSRRQGLIHQPNVKLIFWAKYFYTGKNLHHLPQPFDSWENSAEESRRGKRKIKAQSTLHLFWY